MQRNQLPVELNLLAMQQSLLLVQDLDNHNKRHQNKLDLEFLQELVLISNHPKLVSGSSNNLNNSNLGSEVLPEQVSVNNRHNLDSD